MAYSGLCFTANTAGSTIELCKRDSPSIANTAYSLDGTTWTTFTPEEYSTSTGANTITLTNAGDKVYFRNNITGNFTIDDYLQFKMTGSISASGNCNSIYDASNFENLTTLSYGYCYYSLFHNCASLVAPPELPAIAFSYNARNAYSYMFAKCINLLSAPELPATTLVRSCYENMFWVCESLQEAPKLPATTLADECYSSMFMGCTSLTSVPELHVTDLKANSYSGMFSGCTSLIVSDTQTADAPYEWKIPSSGTFTNTTTYNQLNMFTDCLGTRSSDDMSGAYGESHIYYTQNEPLMPKFAFLKNSSGKFWKSSGKIIYINK